jgi:hypothetical protein
MNWREHDAISPFLKLRHLSRAAWRLSPRPKRAGWRAKGLLELEYLRFRERSKSGPAEE